MITKSTTYGTTEDVMVLEFGAGDIKMLGFGIGEEKSIHLGFKQTENENPVDVILDHADEDDSFDLFKPQMVMIFKRRESILSVIHQLEDGLKEFDKQNSSTQSE